MVDLAQTITEWKDVEGNKVTLKKPSIKNVTVEKNFSLFPG